MSRIPHAFPPPFLRFPLDRTLCGDNFRVSPMFLGGEYGSNALVVEPYGRRRPETLVLVHGLSHRMTDYMPLATRLAAGYRHRSIAVPNPGHEGCNEISKEEYVQLKISDYAASLAANLRSISPYLLESESLYVVAHSLGGVIALEALTLLLDSEAENREQAELVKRFKGLILVSSAGTSFFRMPMNWAILRCFVSNLDILTYHFGRPFGFKGDKFVTQTFLSQAQDMTKEEITNFLQTRQLEPFILGLQLLLTCFPWWMPFLHYKPNIHLPAGFPVLNLYAGQDKLIHRATAHDIEKCLVGQGSVVHTAEIWGASHDSMLTHPDELAAHMVCWINDNKYLVG